jgi:hypothetical protein
MATSSPSCRFCKFGGKLAELLNQPRVPMK